jgi:nuclear pore complex protein Nup53
MEPMNLGSPTHSTLGSPVSPMSPGCGGFGMQQGYLPGYLMGDPLSPAAPSPISRQITSPNKLNRSHSNMTTSGLTSVPTTPLAYQVSRQHSLFKETLSTSGRLGGRSEKGGGGPPTVNLMSTVHTPNSAVNSPFRPETSHLDNSHLALSAARMREVTAHDEVDPMSVWVTVFGFPQAAASFIVSQLAACGTVLSQSIPTNGNWMHLRFQTKLQAKKALSKNGTVVGGTIMIGIRPCTDESVLEQGNTTCGNASMLETSCNASQIANLSTGFGTPRTIRPLTQAFKEAQGESKVVPAFSTLSMRH